MRIRTCGCTCAKSHSAKSASAMLRAWPTMRSAPRPPEAEETADAASASVSAIAAMSGPSMRRAKMSKMRLIMFLVFAAHLVGIRQLLHRALLAKQVEVEHLACDGAGGRIPTR